MAERLAKKRSRSLSMSSTLTGLPTEQPSVLEEVANAKRPLSSPLVTPAQSSASMKEPDQPLGTIEHSSDRRCGRTSPILHANFADVGIPKSKAQGSGLGRARKLCGKSEMLSSVMDSFHHLQEEENSIDFEIKAMAIRKEQVHRQLVNLMKRIVSISCSADNEFVEERLNGPQLKEVETDPPDLSALPVPEPGQIRQEVTSPIVPSHERDPTPPLARAQSPPSLPSDTEMAPEVSSKSPRAEFQCQDEEIHENPTTDPLELRDHVPRNPSPTEPPESENLFPDEEPSLDAFTLTIKEEMQGGSGPDNSGWILAEAQEDFVAARGALILLSDNDRTVECLADSDCSLDQLKQTVLENMVKGDDQFSPENLRLAVRLTGWIISTDKALQLIVKKFAGQELEIVALFPGDTLKRGFDDDPRNLQEPVLPFAPVEQAVVPPANPATTPTGLSSLTFEELLDLEHGTPQRPKQFYGTGKNSYKAAKEGWIDEFRVRLPPSLSIGDATADPATKTLLVHFLVEEARAHKRANVTAAEYRLIAQRIIRMHPGYREEIAGVAHGSGVESLVVSMTKRQQRLEGKDPAKLEVQQKSKKVLVNKEKSGPYKRAEHGAHKNVHNTANFYPNAQVTPIEHQKKDQMNSLLKAGQTVSFELMTGSFNMQRSMIASSPEIVDVQNEWPYLFQKEGLMAHFEILTGKKLTMETLQSRLQSFELKIKEVCGVMGYETTFSDETPVVEDLLKALAMLLFRSFEDYELIYLETQDDIPIGEISQHAKLANTKHPRVVKMRSSTIVYIDGLTIVFDHLFEAVVGMIAAAFVFNYSYHEKTKPFCDFFARYVMEVAENKAVPESKQLYEKLTDCQPQRRRKMRKMDV